MTAPPDGPRFRTRDEIFAAAKSHPFYRDTLDGIDTFEESPVTTKSFLRRAIGNAMTSADSLVRTSIYWSPSGGTTADGPFDVPTDASENRLAREFLACALKKFGVFDEKTVCLNMFADGPHRSKELVDDLGARCGASMRSIGNATGYYFAEAQLDRFRPNMLAGPPTLLSAFAAHLDRRGRAFEIPVLLTAADKLYQAQADHLRKAFGAKQILELYGSAETGVWAFRPSGLAGKSRFIFDPRMVHVEILDPDDHGVGRVVVTPLNRFRIPIFRFDTGDLGRMTQETVNGTLCPVLEFSGRGGRSFQLNADHYSLDEIERALNGLVASYQLVLTHDRGLERACCRVVMPEHASAGPAAIEKAVRTACPVDRVEVVGFGDLELTHAGKVKRIVDRRT